MFTGSRSDYGLLRPLLRGIQAEPALKLQLLVSGAHLQPEYGDTWREISADGFEIDATVPMPLDEDTPVGLTRAMGTELSGLAVALHDLQPDLLVVLGDRYEMLAVVVAALLASVPVAHLHGGERTEGAIDEGVRHAVTKMAHLHLVAAVPFRDRVVQLGEDPDRVHVTGSPGLDELLGATLPERDELGELLGLDLQPPVVVMTYHPVTVPGEDPVAAVDEILAALEMLDGATVVVTRPNPEVGSHAVRDRVDRWIEGRNRAAVYTSLGRRRYSALIAHADVVLGNSSSGLIDAPALGTPTVNVGSRQDGRLRADSVLDCPPRRDAIAASLKDAVSERMQSLGADATSPYGDGHAVDRIIPVLRDTDLDGILVKRFHDLPVPGDDYG